MPDFNLDRLRDAVSGRAAAFRARVKLQPAGGPGTKVFPPTYSGAVYAVEKRRLPDHADPVSCVLLDSVQSQANRMEEALQTAVDAGRISLPVIEVDFSDYFASGGKPTDEQPLLDPVGRVTSLQAPHRIADAILRDSVVPDENDKPFRHRDFEKESSYGQRLRRVSAQDATVLFELCPTALLFGMWDSTGPKGGLGAKFERAMVSEIVGVHAVFGVKTSSRIDPLAIAKKAGPLFAAQGGSWTLDPNNAVDELNKKGEPTGNKQLFRKTKKGPIYVKPETLDEGKDIPEQGKPSKANHGNVTPDLNWETDEKGNPVTYKKQEADGLIYNPTKDAWQRASSGGVTIDSAEQTIVLSLPALRRLKFPPPGEKWEPTDNQRERDTAARTVLAALGLCAAALADESGLDLRSRCLLWPTDEALEWERLERGKVEAVSLTADEAVELLKEAVAAAKTAGLPWRNEPLALRPSSELVKLVARSQELSVGEGGEAE